ncbi:MAG: class I SAM-dependent methyltransferase [Promethearchaeota archaeon]|jgi:18S rRNA (guanine1575-N7)-methyltransferase
MSNGYNFFVKRKRPEEIYKDVREYYNVEMISWYSTSKNIMKIQEKITRRALELLDLRKQESLILDAGSGPGFAALYLKEVGYKIVALDLILEFLSFYEINDLNQINSDMCFPPFRPSTFDAIISISALQWIYRDINNNLMFSMLKSLFKTFFQILKKNSMVLMQFYPKSKEIMDEIGKTITNHTDFKGEFIIDNPNSKKKRKIFLLLKKK